MVDTKKRVASPEEAMLISKEVKMTYVEHMTPDVCYVVTWMTEKTKRSVTGYYVTHDGDELTLMDEKGRFKRAPIDRIIRINFYHEGRAPFERY